MEIDDLEKIIKLFKSSDLVKLEWHNKDGENLVLEKSPHQVSNVASVGTTQKQLAANTPDDSRIKQAHVESEEEPAASDDIYYITAPFVGTFYRSSSPENPPFVNLGDVIQKGTTLCIIEAMKLMNEIESEVSGVLVSIMVENGQSVEFGTKIFAIRPE